MGSCKIQAKDLVRTRRYIGKFYAMRTQLQAVSLRLQTLRSNQQMAEAMKGATRAMSMMSRTMNLPQISKILQDFERESSAMDMKEEMMGDTIDDIMDDEGETEEEESDKILKQVLDELGVNMSQQLGETPTALGSSEAVPEQRQAVALGSGDAGPSSSLGGQDSEVDDLQARLDKLRRD
ncbi:ESCRT-III subunit protein did4 [Cystobasidiomycetes sp. EMM_F5]